MIRNTLLGGMIMSLPNTLDDMQLQILHEDLADNPYLQPHAIAGKDKELKTNSKKIIPAINELLKNLTVVNQTMQGFTDEVNQSIDAVSVELKAYIDKGLEDTVNKNTEEIGTLKQLMEEYMNHSLSEKVEQLETSFTEKMESMQLTYDQRLSELEERIANLNNSSSGAGGEEVRKVFHSKITIAAGRTVTLPFKASEFHPLEQMEVYSNGSSSATTASYLIPLVFSNTSNSAHYYSDIPNILTNVTTDEVTLSNGQSYGNIIVYLYELK